ncbi:unnamed protein product [Clonostachys solani]|uniref:SnoaL-like domain-containing protein n=1 Tax=Clonostachys solani TaxID=160281 RepID=A0A9P0ENT4_9HYPO|nr:unnamed protein product [Clonostachys solani]
MLPIKTLAVCLVSLPFSSCAPTECCATKFNTPAHYDKVIHNYLNAWNGDLSLVNSTFAPALSLQGDILPNGAGGYSSVGELVHTASDFEQFIRRARSNFEVYTFTLNKWAGSNHNVVGRWTLNAVIADTFVLFPTTLKPGDKVSYNGTDFLTIDPCTGLITEVAIAQDLFSLAVNLGNDVIIQPRS